MDLAGPSVAGCECQTPLETVLVPASVPFLWIMEKRSPRQRIRLPTELYMANKTKRRIDATQNRYKVYPQAQNMTQTLQNWSGFDLRPSTLNH